MLRLFDGSAYLRAALIWRLDAAKNCINYVTIIFRIKGAELTSFDFDHIRAAVLINFFFQMRRLFDGGALSEAALYGTYKTCAARRQMQKRS